MATWRQWYHGYSTRHYGPDPRYTWLSWIGDQRIAVGSVPTAATLPRLLDQGVTHIVNCRSIPQTWVSQDLAVERALLGPARVAHAPMWDSGRPQPPRLWSAAAHFAARALTDDLTARVLVHCQQGRRRSVLLAYAVLRLRGLSPREATALLTQHRVEAEIVDTYTASVERWLAAGAGPVGRLRIR
jgi:protein-tyrosine phosphatase